MIFGAIRDRTLLWLAAGVLALSVTVSRAASALPPAGVNDTLIQGDTLPRTLAEFGFFLDGAARDPDRRLIPYELNTPLFSDGAEKLRYLYIPRGAMIETDGDGLLQFPVGSAIIKTFVFEAGAFEAGAFEMRADGGSADGSGGQRYIETRVLLHRASGWTALPYLWDEGQTEARLALAGARLPITTPQGEEISYRVPNKNQCKTCHSTDGEIIPIGPKARNLAPELLHQLVAEGRMDGVPAIAEFLPVWAARNDGYETAALARGYLDVNCAHCHQPGGGASNSGLDLRWEQDDPYALGIRKPPVAAGRGAGGHAFSVEPGDPDASITVYRMSSTEPGIAMPELGRSTNDAHGIAAVRAWIAEMNE